MGAPLDIETVSDAERASLLMNPLRAAILSELVEPASATTIAERLNESRQKVNYHVRELRRGRFLRRAGKKKKRGMTEQRYVATARSYVLAPEVLGPLQADTGEIEDALSAGMLLALAARTTSELSRAAAEAAEQDKRLSTMSINTALEFESVEQRTAFAKALRDAIAKVVGKHSNACGTGGRPYRLVVGCYPIPPEDES